jgi:hypothetical protein
MALERFVTLLPRLVLYLSLLVSGTGLAQGSEELPPLVRGGESPEQQAPSDEVIPREQDDDGEGAARRAGRFLLQPPAGLLAGAVGGAVGFLPALAYSAVFCDLIRDGTSATDCTYALAFSGTALSVSIGAGLGVMGVGHLLDGKARFGAVLGGAMLGSAVAGAIARQNGWALLDLETMGLLWIAPVIGATLAYAVSGAYYPDPTRRIRAVPPAPKDEDEYVQVLPMFGPTQTGGIIGGLAGRF